MNTSIPHIFTIDTSDRSQMGLTDSIEILLKVLFYLLN